MFSPTPKCPAEALPHLQLAWLCDPVGPYLALQPGHLAVSSFLQLTLLSWPAHPSPSSPTLEFWFLPLPAWGRGRLLVALIVFSWFDFFFLPCESGFEATIPSRPATTIPHPRHPTLLTPLAHSGSPCWDPPRLLGDQKRWGPEPAGACRGPRLVLPLITRLDPPFRSVIWGGGPSGPIRPVGSALTLFPTVHLKPAAEGWRSKAGGQLPQIGQNTASASTPAGWAGAGRVESHLPPTAPSAAASGKPTRLLPGTETSRGPWRPGQHCSEALDAFAAGRRGHLTMGAVM